MLLIVSPLVARSMAALLVVYWLTLLVSTHWPNPALGAAAAVSDKTLHLAAYGLLGFLLACTTAAYRRITELTYLALALVVLVYGAFDELSQMPIPGRHAELGDWLADAGGALLGLAAYRLAVAVRECWGGGRGETSAS